MSISRELEFHKNKLLVLDSEETEHKGYEKKYFERLSLSISFIEKYINTNCGACLDIGDQNYIGTKIASHFGMQYYYTIGDLNWNNWYLSTDNKPDVVFCFRVLEYLLNPLLFLSRLRINYCNEETLIFLFYPQNPCFFEGMHHFHHFTDKEFNTLITMAEFDIIARQKVKLWCPWWFYLTGIRPIIKFFILLFSSGNANFYLLKIKDKERKFKFKFEDKSEQLSSV